MGEELDDEEVIVCPTCPACEVVVLQPNTRIGFAVILDDVVGRPKTLREARAMHIAPKHFRPWPLGAKAVPFSIIVPTVMQVACAVLGACLFIPPPRRARRRASGLGCPLRWPDRDGMGPRW
jgi:hypothetical protein